VVVTYAPHESATRTTSRPTAWPLAVVPVDDHRARRAEACERHRDEFRPAFVVHAEELSRCAGRVGEGAEEVEDRRESKRLPRPGSVAHRGVVLHRETKAHAHFFKTPRLNLRTGFDVHTERLKNLR